MFRLFSDIEMKHVVYMYKTLNEFLLRNQLHCRFKWGGGGVGAWSCPQAPLIAIGTSWNFYWTRLNHIKKVNEASHKRQQWKAMKTNSTIAISAWTLLQVIINVDYQYLYLLYMNVEIIISSWKKRKLKLYRMFLYGGAKNYSNCNKLLQTNYSINPKKC